MGKDNRHIIVDGPLAYVPLTLGMVAVIDAEDVDLVAPYVWHAFKHGRTFYARTNVKRNTGKGYTSLRMHRLILRALGVALEEMSKNSRSMPPSQVRPCTYDGADFPSMMAAAQAAGMQPAAFRKHLLRRARLIELVKKTFGYWPTEDGGMPPANMDGQMAERMAAE